MSNPTGVTFTAGIVGHGVGQPPPTLTRSDLCASMGHPGCTYNVALDRTWCLCGEVQTPGDTAVPHIACCGGPLTAWYCQPCADYHDAGASCPASIHKRQEES